MSFNHENCKSEIYWFESNDPVYCYLPRLLVPLPSLLWRLGLAWFGLQCQCWFAEIFPENDHSLVLLLTFAIFISLTYQNDCKTILIKDFMVGTQINCLYLLQVFKITLTWGIPENVHSYSCWVLLFQSLTWSQNDCKTILFKELILGMEKNKSIWLYLIHYCFDLGKYEPRIQTSFCFTL